MYKQIKVGIERFQFDVFRRVITYLRDNLFEIEIIFVSAVMLGMYRHIPYVNLIISTSTYYFLLVLIAIRILSITTRNLLIVVSLTFIAIAGFAVKTDAAVVDLLSNLVYFVLCYIVIRMTIDQRKQI